MQGKDIKTLGYVVKRINYSEFDRILSIITPTGKISVLAKGVRKEKSKLAGSIEMFTLINFNIHIGRGEFGLLTGAKIVSHYSNIVKDLARMELSAMILKRTSRLAESSDASEYFEITNKSLSALNMGGRLDIVEAWFLVNLKKTMGEEINFYRDNNGEKLIAENVYSWDNIEMAFKEDENGVYGVNEIKFLRLLASNDLNVIQRVKISDDKMASILRLVREVI